MRHPKKKRNELATLSRIVKDLANPYFVPRTNLDAAIRLSQQWVFSDAAVLNASMAVESAITIIASKRLSTADKEHLTVFRNKKGERCPRLPTFGKLIQMLKDKQLISDRCAENCFALASMRNLRVHPSNLISITAKVGEETHPANIVKKINKIVGQNQKEFEQLKQAIAANIPFWKKIDVAWATNPKRIDAYAQEVKTLLEEYPDDEKKTSLGGLVKFIAKKEAQKAADLANSVLLELTVITAEEHRIKNKQINKVC